MGSLLLLMVEYFSHKIVNETQPARMSIVFIMIWQFTHSSNGRKSGIDLLV